MIVSRSDNARYLSKLFNLILESSINVTWRVESKSVIAQAKYGHASVEFATSKPYRILSNVNIV
jgi:hypothetical protein